MTRARWAAVIGCALLVLTIIYVFSSEPADKRCARINQDELIARLHEDRTGKAMHPKPSDLAWYGEHCYEGKHR